MRCDASYGLTQVRGSDSTGTAVIDGGPLQLSLSVGPEAQWNPPASVTADAVTHHQWLRDGHAPSSFAQSARQVLQTVQISAAAYATVWGS